MPTPWARSEGDDLPPEIARIAEGGVTVFKGGLMNPGQQTWYALDVQRRRFIAVLRHTDTGAGSGPPQATGLVRRPAATAPPATEVLQQAPASALQCQAFAALVERLRASPTVDAADAPVPQGPLRRTLVLLHQGRALDMPQGPAAAALQAGIVRLIQEPLQALLRGPG